MELLFKATFIRELSGIKQKDVLKRVYIILHQIEKAKTPAEIGGIRKLEEYAHFYRIKIKMSDRQDYRLVLMIRGNKVWALSIVRAAKVFYKR